MQQGVMEYHHPGVGTIAQSTWWVQCTHVHVVYGYVNRKYCRMMGIAACEGVGKEWRWSKGEEEEGSDMRRGGRRIRRGNSTIDGRWEATVEEM